MQAVKYSKNVSKMDTCTVPRFGKEAQHVPLHDSFDQRSGDNVSDIRKAGSIQSALNKKTKFSGNFEQLDKVTFQLFKRYSRQNNLHPD